MCIRDRLQQMLISAANLPTVTQNDVIVTNIRHYEALTHALEDVYKRQRWYGSCAPRHSTKLH